MGYYSSGDISLTFENPVEKVLDMDIIDETFEKMNLWFENIDIGNKFELFLTFYCKWYDAQEEGLLKFCRKYGVREIGFYREGEEHADIEDWRATLDSDGKLKTVSEILRVAVEINSLVYKLHKVDCSEKLTTEDRVALELILSKYNTNN